MRRKALQDRQRLSFTGYRMEQMLNAYGTIYREFAESMQKPWMDNEVEMTDHQSAGSSAAVLH